MPRRTSAHHEHIDVEQVLLIWIGRGQVFSAGFVDKSGRSKNGGAGDGVFEVVSTIHGDKSVGGLGFQKDTIQS